MMIFHLFLLKNPFSETNILLIHYFSLDANFLWFRGYRCTPKLNIQRMKNCPKPVCRLWQNH